MNEHYDNEVMNTDLEYKTLIRVNEEGEER